MPDGIFSDSQDFCELLEFYGNLLPFPFNCDSTIPLGGIDVSLGFLKGKVAFPTGNTMAFGGFESCLSVQTTLQNGTETNPLSIPNFNGKHMRIKIKSQSSMGPKPDSRMAPIIAGSSLLEPIIENFLNISFNGPAEDIVSQLCKCVQISKVLTFVCSRSCSCILESEEVSLKLHNSAMEFVPLMFVLLMTLLPVHKYYSMMVGLMQKQYQGK